PPLSKGLWIIIRLFLLGIVPAPHRHQQPQHCVPHGVTLFRTKCHIPMGKPYQRPRPCASTRPAHDGICRFLCSLAWSNLTNGRHALINRLGPCFTHLRLCSMTQGAWTHVPSSHRPRTGLRLTTQPRYHPSTGPASAQNTAIVVKLPSFGAGITNAAVVAYGFQALMIGPFCPLLTTDVEV